jgi:hypothetical protein
MAFHKHTTRKTRTELFLCLQSMVLLASARDTQGRASGIAKKRHFSARRIALRSNRNGPTGTINRCRPACPQFWAYADIRISRFDIQPEQDSNHKVFEKATAEGGKRMEEETTNDWPRGRGSVTLATSLSKEQNISQVLRITEYDSRV